MKFDARAGMNWLRSLGAGFSEAWQATAIVVATSLVLLLMQAAFPEPIHMMRSSRETPWGVVTGIFVHGDFLHFFSNSIGLTIFTFFLAGTNADLPEHVRLQRTRFYVLGMFTTGILAKILWLVFVPQSISFGSSGVVYAAEGIMLGYAVSNLLPPRSTMNNVIRYYKERRVHSHLALNLTIFIPLFVMAKANPTLFLAAGEGVNVFAHGFSFMLAFFTTIVMGWFEGHPLAKPPATMADAPN